MAHVKQATRKHCRSMNWPIREGALNLGTMKFGSCYSLFQGAVLCIVAGRVSAWLLFIPYHSHFSTSIKQKCVQTQAQIFQEVKIPDCEVVHQRMAGLSGGLTLREAGWPAGVLRTCFLYPSFRCVGSNRADNWENRKSIFRRTCWAWQPVCPPPYKSGGDNSVKWEALDSDRPVPNHNSQFLCEC